jgi:hypothetical protein
MPNPAPPGRSKIRYAEDEFSAHTLPAWLDALDARAAQAGIPRPPRPVGEAPAAPPVTARMNYGRWIADCECHAAVLLFRGEQAGRWFWCPACGNAGAGGKLRPVVWPPDRERIDRDMATLPAAVANWDPAAASARAAGNGGR